MISPMLSCSLLYNYNPLQIALSAVLDLDHVNLKSILYSTATPFVNHCSFTSLIPYSSMWVLNQEILDERCDVRPFLEPAVPQ